MNPHSIYHADVGQTNQSFNHTGAGAVWQAAFQAVVWADRTIPEEAWDMLPPEIQEVIQLIRSLRRAEGIPAFVGGAGVSKVGARELLACAQEGLGERHERLCKAMSDVAARLVLSCIRPSGGLQDVGDSVIWGCAHGAAVQLVIDALQEPSWRSSQHSLKAKFDYLVHRIFSADAVRQEELEIAQRHLDYLMPLEQKIRKAMAIVRTLWMVQGGREGSGSGGSEATSDPLQDVAFLSGLHGKGWRARHSASYVESFHASRQDVLAVILDALSGKVI